MAHEEDIDEQDALARWLSQDEPEPSETAPDGPRPDGGWWEEAAREAPSAEGEAWEPGEGPVPWQAANPPRQRSRRRLWLVGAATVPVIAIGVLLAMDTPDDGVDGGPPTTATAPTTDEGAQEPSQEADPDDTTPEDPPAADPPANDGQPDEGAHDGPTEDGAPTEQAAEAPVDDSQTMWDAAAAAATTALHLALTGDDPGAGEGAVRYVDHAAAEAVAAHDDLVVVTVRAVVLHGDGSGWDRRSPARWAVPLVHRGGVLVAAGAPWPLPPPSSTPSDAAWERVDRDDVRAAVGAHLAAAGWEAVEVTGVAVAPDSSLVRVSVRGRALGELGVADHELLVPDDGTHRPVAWPSDADGPPAVSSVPAEDPGEPTQPDHDGDSDGHEPEAEDDGTDEGADEQTDTDDPGATT